MGSIDYMFQQLAITNNSWATTLAGFILVLIIVFGAIAFFGKSKQNLGAFGIILFTFIGTILATAMGLFPAIVLILIVVITLIFILIKTLFGGNK